MENLTIDSDVETKEFTSGSQLYEKLKHEFENDKKVEVLWAIQAHDHAEVYFNLICSVDPKLLKLTPCDDKIYKEFRRLFPDMPLDILDEDIIKSELSKIKWRRFSLLYKNMKNYNFGTLIRKDVQGENNETNYILLIRIQFYAIEIARNREGLNDIHFINNIYYKNLKQ